MAQNMSFKRYTRIFYVILMLLMCGAGEVWAITTDDIIINKLPNDAAGSVAVSVSNRTVTLTINPASGFFVNKNTITAEKMVELPASSRRRAPIMANALTVNGDDEASNGNSKQYTFDVPEGFGGAYVTVEFYKKTAGFTQITSLDEITDFTGATKYELTCDIDATGFEGFTTDFKGVFDGGLHTITNLEAPLFNTATDATISNIILENVSINVTTTNTNVGALVCEAKDETRIYNCGILSGSVSGTKYVGGFVGLLDHKGETGKGSRVINCFSYADVGGGTDVGGIVGYNNYSTTSSDIRTMVMNCMFYGDITSGTRKSPIYGGNIINNASSTGLNNYNYYRYESNYSKNNQITSDKYNCALAAEEKYLTHFELYRLLLNSNKKLAAWYASTSGTTVNPTDIAKWVLETADRTINNPMPYPILKAQGKYPSIINYDDDHVTDLTSSLVNNKPREEDRNKGGKLGSLNVTISDNDNASDKGSRSGSFITTGFKKLPITDKDVDRYNYNYYKVRLPYYNEVGKDNYKDAKVVTGWIVTSMTGATPTQATSSSYDVTITDGVITATPYNFADRTCTMDENGDYRVFSQGAYLDIPIGVTAITIKPYWANAAFLSDINLDKTYTNKFAVGGDVAGGQYTGSGTPQEVHGISMKVRNDFTTALSDITTKGPTVYDNAIVLVGNVHQNGIPYYSSSLNTSSTVNTNPSFTVMSADFDNDNEPDFSMIYQHYDRKEVAPIRFDFINILGTSMAQKPNGSAEMWGIGTFKPSGWFEVTNTTLISFGQIEFDFEKKNLAPLILLGGEVLQIVTNNSGSNTATTNYTNHTKYFLVGGNVWFKVFHNGTHIDKTNDTPHRPISVTGGRYERFYLSGYYRPDVDAVTDDAECYISGGSFGEVAGAGQEQIKGNVNWIIDYADIDNFYGGGLNATMPITGDINVTIRNSHVDVYCGGPKFGNMTGVDTPNNTDDDKTVTTNAEGCVFRRYFGAGYGGTSYYKYSDASGLQQNNMPNSKWDTWDDVYIGERGKYNSGRNGIATNFEYEYFIGSKGTIWGRFYINYASFSKAITNNVYSNLTGCHITGDFYGGGSLGVVQGTAYSTLDGCIVDGSVFGGGYSASIPTVDIVSSGFSTSPTYDSKAGIFTPAVYSASALYKWKTGTLANNSTALGTDDTDGSDVIYTDQVLTNLGQVDTVSLILKGDTYIKSDLHKYNDNGEIITAETKANGGGVFGGGDESAVNGNVTVKLQGKTEVLGNVFGGGNVGLVSGNTTVNIED